jgi:hypothetical protein
MSDPCLAHRPYLAAFADGELDLIPEATREHVTACSDCSAEIAGHGLVGEKLRRGLQMVVYRDAGHRGWVAGVEKRVAMLGVAAVVLFAGLAATLGWRATHGSLDPVVAAVAAADEQPTLRSTNPATIGAWCARASERAQPPVVLSSLQPVGVRMDTAAGTNIVTIFYTSGEGDRVTVGWLDTSSAPQSGSSVEARDVSGRLVLVLRTPIGTAVLTGGGSPTELWNNAATIESISR